MLSSKDIQALKTWSDTDFGANADNWDEDKVPEEYAIEMLDYSYVKTCKSIRDLKQILAVLRSGKEGLYTDLEKAVENRIHTLGGQLKARPLPANAIPSTLKNEIDNNLNEWIETLESQPFISKQQGHLELENTKGNEAMRAKDYQEALTWYLRCLKSDTCNPKYCSNASLAYLKLKDYDHAIELATRGLQNTNSNNLMYKCFLRRATAYYHQGQYAKAFTDVDSCSMYDKECKEHDKLKYQIETKWRDVDFPAYKDYIEHKFTISSSSSFPFSSTSSAVKIEVVDDSDDEDNEMNEAT